MAELKPNFFAQKRDQLVAIAGFSAYSLFFLFFCIGLVNLGGTVFGMTEMFNFFDDPVKYLVDGVFGLIKSLFSEEGNWFEGQGSQLFFIMGSFIAFIVFLVKFIFTVISFVNIFSGKTEWSDAAAKFEKKFAWCFAFVLGYIVLAYMWMGGDWVDLSVCGVFFVIISVLYFLCKAALDQYNDASVASNVKLQYIGINGAYNVLKVVCAILALSFLLDRALILEFIYMFKDILLAVLHGAGAASRSEAIKNALVDGLVPYISFILMYSALGGFQKSLKANINNNEDKAKKVNKQALIICGIALVVDLIVSLAVSELSFGDWFDFQGGYFIWSTVFVGLAFGVFFLRPYVDQLIAKFCGAKADVEAPVAEEAAREEAEEADKAE